MPFNQKHLIILLFTVISVSIGREYDFSLSSKYPIKFTSHHWKHPQSNSSMDINGIEIDMFRWRAVAKSQESVKVDLVNPIWEFAGWANDEMVLPEIIEISNVFNFRETPTTHIKVMPWRIIGNEVEALTNGKIKIWIEPANLPITFSHPYLLNGEKNTLQRIESDKIEYLIICPNRFSIPAQSLADIHSSELNTEIILTDDIIGNITGMDIRNYVTQQMNDDLLSSNGFLVLFGDENDLPPIKDLSDSYPSDDYYTTPEGNIYDGDPQLYTGRIPVNTVEDAITIVEKIHDYIVNPTPGIWKSKVALVADDMYRSCSMDGNENSHTLNSQGIYETLKDLVPVLPFYGIHYGLQQTSAGCVYPDLTHDLIQTINNGIALINYIGHGDINTWAGEKIITKARDLQTIHPTENKLAIWVAGTCSFGNYHGTNSFMEELLSKKDGAIAVIASTETIGYTENKNYIDAFFNELSNYIMTESMQSVLGEMVWNAKNGDKKFHTFGDPALPLPFPKIKEGLINDDIIGDIHLIDEENISFNESSNHSSILIHEDEKDFTYHFESDSLTYTMPGATYVQLDVSGNSTCFRIPLDAGTCDGCVVIQAYQENLGWDGQIETLSNISIVGSVEEHDDIQGPEILLFHGNRTLNNGSIIFPDIDIIVSLTDNSGINLMNESIGHGIRYSFDDENLILISGNEFNYSDCSTGSAIIPIPSSLSLGEHEFYIEAWDGLNNKSMTKITLELISPISEDMLSISKVYPIPNPFSEGTYFTMYVSDYPAIITITIYSLNGERVRLLTYEANETFVNQIYWNGKDEHGRKIANGAYFYHVKVETENKKQFENIYKLAKIE